MNRYKDYMDGVEASDALHEKLKNLEEPKKQPRPWAKWGAMAAAFALIVGAGAWGLSRFGGEEIAGDATVPGIVDVFPGDIPAIGTVGPGREDIPAPFPAADIAPAGPFADPDAPSDKTGGGYEVVDGEFAAYYVLPYLEWADASQVGLAFDHDLERFDAITRDADWDDVLLFTGGEKAMADHLLWDGLDWGGRIWLGEDGTPDAARLYAQGRVFQFSLEVVEGKRLPFCIVLDEGYEPSRWNGAEILAVKDVRNGDAPVINGLELREMREIEFYSNGVDYKLTLYTNTVNAGRADEMCARFVRYAVDGGFSLSVLPFRAGDLPNKGLPPEGAPGADILHPGDPGYIEPFPAVPDGAPQTTPYNPNMTAEAKAPAPPN